MMKKNIIYLFLISLGLIFALGGCSDDGDGTKIYIPQAGTVVNTKFIIKDEPYIQTFNVAVTSDKYPAPANTGISNDIKVYLDVDQAKVAAYNSQKGTSYKMMPEGSYSFPKKAVIKAGVFYSDLLSLSIDAKGKIEAFQDYLLPISVKSVEGGSPDDCHQTVYFLINGSLDASDMIFLDRTNWKVVEVSSEELVGEGANNGNAKHAFDGNGETFWHTQWEGDEPQPPHHIVVDMGEELELNGFSYLSRNNGADWPEECIIQVSKDGIIWEDAAKFTNLPAAGATEFRSFLPKVKEGRYFKMIITAVYRGPSTHVAEINMF